MRAALPAEVPVLVAGGLANGSQLAGMLAMGAAGAVYGTRFLLAPESKYNDSQRAALLAASSSSTVRTMAFDHARMTIGTMWKVNTYLPAIKQCMEDSVDADDEGVDASVTVEADVVS